MAEIGHPLIGDMVYGAGFKTKASALDEACRDGRIRPGHLVMLEAVGGGFTWGSALLRW